MISTLTRGSVTYVFCSPECQIDFTRANPPMWDEEPALYGCWQCGQNLIADLPRMPNKATEPLPIKEWYGRKHGKTQDATWPT